MAEWKWDKYAGEWRKGDDDEGNYELGPSDPDVCPECCGFCIDVDTEELCARCKGTGESGRHAFIED